MKLLNKTVRYGHGTIQWKQNKDDKNESLGWIYIIRQKILKCKVHYSVKR
jgi:hypothetical protein